MDDWHDSYNGAPADGSAWIDDPRGNLRVSRGGAFAHVESAVRAAFRYYGLEPVLRDPDLGFRVVVSPFSSSNLKLTVDPTTSSG